jgi:hypothetical protein
MLYTIIYIEYGDSITCSRHMTSFLKYKYNNFHSYVVAKWW